MLKFIDDDKWLGYRLNGVRKAYKIPKTDEIMNVAVDVGANVGAFSLINYDKFNRIICIEPAEYTVNECIKNTKKYNNVETYKFAVAAESNKIIKLKNHCDGKCSGNASVLNHVDWDENDFEYVETISLVDIFKKFDIDVIDYLKVDCEGGEYDFLMNQDLSNVKYLAIEIHTQLKEKAIELENYLKKFFVPISEIGDGKSWHRELTLKNRKYDNLC